MARVSCFRDRLGSPTWSNASGSIPASGTLLGNLNHQQPFGLALQKEIRWRENRKMPTNLTNPTNWLAGRRMDIGRERG